MSLTQGRILVVPFISHDNEGDGFSSSYFPFVCHPSQMPRKRLRQREDEDEERGERTGRVCYAWLKIAQPGFVF